MSLETLVEEIVARSQAELREVTEGQAKERARLTGERDRRLAAIRARGVELGSAEAERVRSLRLAAAKVAARQRVYAARARRLADRLDDVRALLAAYTESDEYAATLRRMVAQAIDALGKQVRITGRAQDAGLLQKAAGKAFDPTPRAILGGLVAETSDRKRQLDLSFDGLLRMREARVREILA